MKRSLEQLYHDFIQFFVKKPEASEYAAWDTEGFSVLQVAGIAASVPCCLSFAFLVGAYHQFTIPILVIILMAALLYEVATTYPTEDTQ